MVPLSDKLLFTAGMNKKGGWQRQTLLENYKSEESFRVKISGYKTLAWSVVMSTFYYLYNENLEPKYDVYIPMAVTRLLRAKTRDILDDFWAQSYNFDNPWTASKIPKMLNAFTHVSALITSFSNYVEKFDNRWSEETYVAMHALATDNTNISMAVVQAWQQSNLGLITGDKFQNQMRLISEEQAKLIGFIPVDEAHLATAIGNPTNFSETLRTSYYYFMEMGDFTEKEFEDFQHDVSYAITSASNTIKMINDGNEDICSLFGHAYGLFQHEFDHASMANHLIEF